MTDAKPYPKAQQLARGPRKYRRKVASPKQWQAIHAAKGSTCRLATRGVCERGVEYHHVIPRGMGGDDVAENIVPLCRVHHGLITDRVPPAVERFCSWLTNAEYAYAIGKLGEGAFERVYGITYGR